jgi:hemerythrin
MVLDWSDDYLIGIEHIDEQHKQFFAIVHRLHEECLTCKGEDVVQETLDFLRDYAVNHFTGEEGFMREHEYPGVDQHAELHAAFLDKYAELMLEFNELGPSQDLAERTADLVQGWLVDHIAEADAGYAAHVKKAS